MLTEITAVLLGATLINFSFSGAQALGTPTLLDAAGPAIPDQLNVRNATYSAHILLLKMHRAVTPLFGSAWLGSCF